MSDQHRCIVDCKGPNAACRRAHKAGRTFHFSPGNFEGQLVALPTYHFVDEAEALAVYDLVASQGVYVHNERERDAAYADGRIVIFAHDYVVTKRGI